MSSPLKFYEWMLEAGDKRVEKWFLLKTPIPIAIIFILYLVMVFSGPRLMANRKALQLNAVIIPYNFFLVILSIYMFGEFFMSSLLSKYSYICQPVDYSDDPLAVRMANVCWWFFFSKVIELLDTAFFIIKKKNNQITFLHVYHHCTMILNWWMAAKYIAGGQSWFIGMANSFVHIFMYSYYFLAALGPQMHPYLWWKKYLTTLQLTQFVMIVTHTVVNLFSGCDFPQALNYVVVFYTITMIILFGNFYYKSYVSRRKKRDSQEAKRVDIKNLDAQGDGTNHFKNQNTSFLRKAAQK